MDSVSRFVRRLTALALALAFSATATAALGAHACPHHDGLPTADAPAGAHAGHDAHGDSGAPEHEGPCTCVGACAMHAPVALPAAAAIRTLDPGALTVAPRIESSTSVVLPAPPFFLPFATAPPIR
jgi:hypothetical protein